MKYYEIKDPYYALIIADDKVKALEIYNEYVCDADDETDVFKISKLKAIFKCLQACLVEKPSNKEALSYYFGMKNTVVLIDRGLM